MRKAVIEVGFYTVREAPNGGWRVHYALNGRVISVHNDKEQALAAARHYQATDQETINRGHGSRVA